MALLDPQHVCFICDPELVKGDCIILVLTQFPHSAAKILQLQDRIN